MKLFRVNFLTISNTGDIRSKSTAIRAEDVTDARTKAAKQISDSGVAEFNITSVREFVSDAPKPPDNQIDAFDQKKNPLPSKAR